MWRRLRAWLFRAATYPDKGVAADRSYLDRLAANLNASPTTAPNFDIEHFPTDGVLDFARVVPGTAQVVQGAPPGGEVGDWLQAEVGTGGGGIFKGAFTMELHSLYIEASLEYGPVRRRKRGRGMTSGGRGGSVATRAGCFVRQPTGYRAFIPAELPPQPPLDLSGALQALLSRADRALGRLDGSIQTLPNADLFVSMYVRKEAVLSSQIEGTQSSLQDVLAAEAQLFDPDRPRDVAEVFNYVNAMNHGLARLAELPVSVRLIREIHERLLRGVRGATLNPGELRTSQNWIGPPGCTLAEASFIPPPPHEACRALSDLERFLHAASDVPLLIKIGLAHAQFETIHPFLDGNGRIGRLLITLLLCEQEVLLKPVLYLSYYFRQHRAEYYDRLQAIRTEGAWEAWLSFLLQGIYEVSQEATATARNVLWLRERHRELISTELGRAAGNGHRTLEHLFEHPIVSVNDVQALVGTTYQAANSLVARLVDQGILQEITGQRRHRRFIYGDYIRLFYDEPVPEEPAARQQTETDVDS